MPRTISYTETLEVTTCWCGIHLAMPENLLRNARNNGTTVYCPLGHTFGWKETEADRLKKRLAAVEATAASRLAAIDQERASHAATKGQLTRAKKRAVNGVCPCCNRSFANVQRHVANQHPEALADLAPDGA